MKKYAILFFILALTVSCSLEIQKRHYRSGYHVSISKKYHQQKKVSAATSEASNVKRSGYEPAVYSNISNSSDQQKRHYPVRTNGNESANSRYTSFIKHTEKTPDGVKSYFHKNKVASKAGKNISATDSKKITTPATENKNSDNWFLSMAGIIAAFFTGLFRPSIQRTKKIGYWALNHRKASRVLHVVAHTILAGCGFFLGKQLHEIGIITTEFTTNVLIAAASTFAVLYPVRKHTSGIFKNTYVKQKLFAMAMVMSGFALFVNIGNRDASHDWKYSPNYRDQNLTASAAPFSTIQNFQESETENNDKAVKIVLTVLTCILSVLLTFLIIAGSCSLSCSGQEALAVVILIFGIPAVIVATVAIIKSIWKPKKVIVTTP